MGRHGMLVRPLGLVATVALTLSLLPVARASAVEPVPLQQVQKLAASGLNANAAFGESVAISGDTAVVGCPHDDSAGAFMGAAYIYRRSGTGWVYHGKLTPATGGTYDLFGWSVDVLDGTILVGAPGADDGVAGAGAAYVYTPRIVGGVPTWSQATTLTASNGANGDEFGGSVALSPGMAVIGAPYKDSSTGSVYVFKGSGASWVEDAELRPDDSPSLENFGGEVAASGGLVLAGCSGDDEAGMNAGAAYVFAEDAGVWAQEMRLTAGPDAASFDSFGGSVAIDGSTAVVGADGSEASKGAAYVFARSLTPGGYAWTRQARLVAADGAAGDAFGSAVAVSGDLAIVGARADADKGIGAGSAYAFSRAGTQWAQRQKLTASDGAVDDEFGDAIDLHKGTAIVGAPQDSSRSGTAYVFGALSPVYRFYNKTVGTHFYTPSEAEKAYVISKLPHVYAYEGIAYKTNPYNNTQPLYRFFNKKNGSHFYTASVAERDRTVATLSHVYAYEGETYKVSPVAAPGKTPVYRFYNKRNGSHFYTASETEKNNVIATLQGVYAFEGVAFQLGH